MKKPYTVEVENNACEHCGSGKSYVIIGPDGVALGQSWENEPGAEELADDLNAAYEHGLHGTSEYGQTAESLGLPVPRLQLRWVHQAGEEWMCYYELVLRLKGGDIRRPEHQPDEYRIVLSRTRSTRGKPPDATDKIDIPFRDGAHARWDADQLKLPIYAVCGRRAMKVDGVDWR